ncbi:site-specific DNA-methyltransferase [Qipengyuania flava]|uniref:site-specific DNA-methyltransferase n=1 Tax=Qipengyuania flava TaxID=192812 RepID=UPI0018DF215F|nr:site-specific DNA-methyltransferase [Qipengyuania flava]
MVEAPPLYIQEKIHPKALIEDLKRASQRDEADDAPDLFADFNGVDPEARTEFYAHDQHWSNRMILGDGLKVMASLAEREGLKGQVQCIYFDPPYGIKFNSNFQWSTTSRDVKDGKADHLTREPEQVKAFRDTWADGIHSYLTYLRDRLTVARDLLTESGSVFVQISDENLHRVRALMDEVFGEENFQAMIVFQKSTGTTSDYLPVVTDYIVWFSKDRTKAKFRQPYWLKDLDGVGGGEYKQARYFGETFSLATTPESEIPGGAKVFRNDNLVSQGFRQFTTVPFEFEGKSFHPGKQMNWKTTVDGLGRLVKSDRVASRKNSLAYVRYLDDFPVVAMTASWNDTAIAGRPGDKVYVVQTSPKVVERCILMTSDPGDLVLDPTCGSGTTAYVAEQWGRRWITIDTSRVALALARARIMGARYPWYLLADSREGQVKEGEITRTPPRDTPTQGRIRQGFVYKRVPHITLKSIANNAEIDTIWEEYQEKLEPLRGEINAMRGRDGSDPELPPFEEWTMPREPGAPWSDEAAKALEKVRGPGSDAVRTKWLGKLNEELGRDYTLDTLPEHPVDPWNDPRAEELHAEWWKLRIERQQEIDASIAAKADTEYLYDQPYEDKARVRVAGPFTVESLSPHRVPAVDVDDSLFDEIEAAEGRAKKGESGERADFAEMVLENLKRSGVQQRAKDDKLVFESMKLWPGEWIVAEGTVRQKSLTEAEDEEETEAGPTRRAAIFVGPEYGTITRPQVVAAAREAQENGFDILIAAAFNFDAHAGEVTKMGPLTVLQARINPDLHMPDLANTGAGNLFTVFGEPDIQVHDEGANENGEAMVSIEVMGVDMYKGGQIESGDAEDIAVWFIDTDYNYESFFVRHAYFPGANDPYKALKTTLKAEVDQEAWDSLNRVRSRPFVKPKDSRVAVKVVNHLGDEVMKVLEV